MASNDSKMLTQTVASRHVDALARTVLTSLRTFPTYELRMRLSHAARELAELTSQADEFDVVAVMDDLRLRRFSHADVMDFCIPEAALVIGHAWHEDHLPFWRVSLAGARMYQLAKRITAEWTGAAGYDARMAVLLVQCQENAHVLGPALLADQLRRAGCSVSTIAAGPETQLAQVMDEGLFDLVVFTCSSLEVLETVAFLVKHTREDACLVPPMVLGGPVIDYAENIRELTGVDLVTKDIKKALSLCARPMAGQTELKVAE